MAEGWDGKRQRSQRLERRRAEVRTALLRMGVSEKDADELLDLVEEKARQAVQAGGAASTGEQP